MTLGNTFLLPCRGNKDMSIVDPSFAAQTGNDLPVPPAKIFENASIYPVVVVDPEYVEALTKRIEKIQEWNELTDKPLIGEENLPMENSMAL